LLVEVVVQASGQRPAVAGKPEPPLMLESVERTAAKVPLVVGDRLDTDIAGANRAGLASLLVLTGVTGPAELITAADDERPTYLAADLRGLLTGPAAVPTGTRWREHAAEMARGLVAPGGAR
jgi:ribonucleotide monophosphatase NagD (HAD superfamily)